MLHDKVYKPAVAERVVETVAEPVGEPIVEQTAPLDLASTATEAVVIESAQAAPEPTTITEAPVVQQASPPSSAEQGEAVKLLTPPQVAIPPKPENVPNQ